MEVHVYLRLSFWLTNYFLMRKASINQAGAEERVNLGIYGSFRKYASMV